MMKLVSLVIVAVVFFASVEPDDSNGLNLGLPCYSSSPIYCWTEWFDSSEPSGSGATENFARIERKYPGKICPNPIDIEAKTLSGLTPEAAGDVIQKSNTNLGFTCRKRNQPTGRCNDYKVRFSCPPPYCAELVCWTKWYDRDHPSGSGDWETLGNLRDENPCWTKWYDRDHPSGSGDWETLGNLRDENPGEICEKPHYIEVVTTDTLTPAIYTGENFYVYNPTGGFVCRKVDQQYNTCRDYKVRFGCPCNH